MKEKGKVIWRMIEEIGVKPVIQRNDLCQILESGIGNIIEYGKCVRGFDQVKGGCKVFIDEEVERCDLLIGISFLHRRELSSWKTLMTGLGADGINSVIRRTLYPIIEYGDMGFKNSDWMTINIKSSSAEIADFIRDGQGVNMVLGKGWSGVLVPLPPSPHLLSSCPSTSSPSISSPCPLNNAHSEIYMISDTHISLTIPLSNLPLKQAISNLIPTSQSKSTSKSSSTSPSNSFLRAIISDPSSYELGSFPYLPPPKQSVERSNVY